MAGLLGLAYLAALAATAPPEHAPSLTAEGVRLRLDLNSATRDELMLLPDIGPALADAIITYRRANGGHQGFGTVEDLDHVRGIGPARLQTLRRHLYVGDFVADAARGAP